MGDVPHGCCHCGCGGRAPIAKRTVNRLGWKKGHPKRYIATHNGTKPIPWDASYVVRPDGCWEWRHSIISTGYGMYNLGHGDRQLAHRVAYEKFKGPIPPGLQIDHLCRNRRCVNPDHLEVVTNAENSRRGARAKLTAPQAQAIREAIRDGADRGAVAEQFGIARSTIGGIMSGARWGGA